VWNGDSLIATIDQPMGWCRTGTAATRYIHPDQFGSTNIVSDESGSVVQDVEYYPYGETRLNQSTYRRAEKRQYIGAVQRRQFASNICRPDTMRRVEVSPQSRPDVLGKTTARRPAETQPHIRYGETTPCTPGY